MVPPLLLAKEGARMHLLPAVSISAIPGDNPHSYNYKGILYLNKGARMPHVRFGVGGSTEE